MRRRQFYLDILPAALEGTHEGLLEIGWGSQYPTTTSR